MNIRYRVELSQSESDQLTALLSGGKHPARKLKRAQILLAADAGASDAEIAARVVVGGSTVYRTKRRFVAGNLELALAEEPRPGAARKLTGKEEALLVATACSDPPAGHRTAHRSGLRRLYARAHRYPLPRGRANPGRARQSLDPQTAVFAPVDEEHTQLAEVHKA
jgi:Homeodomain-like domain